LEPIEERLGEFVALREKDGDGSKALDEVALGGVEVVEAVEEDRRLKTEDGRPKEISFGLEVVVGEPGAVGVVGNGEFVEFWCAGGLGENGRSDTGFVEVGESGEEGGGKPGGGADGIKVAVFGKEVGVGGELTAEEFERERGSSLAVGGKNVREGDEAEVDVARGQRAGKGALEMKGEKSCRTENGDGRKGAAGLLEGGNLASEHRFQVAEGGEEKFAWCFGRKVVSRFHRP
jgi:hypothetical protein